MAIATAIKLPTTDQDPLTLAELRAWRGLLRAHACLAKRLDAELERAPGKVREIEVGLSNERPTMVINDEASKQLAHPTARKHIGWYTRGLCGANAFRHRMNTLDTTREQLAAVNQFFDEQKAVSDRLVYVDDENGADGANGEREPFTTACPWNSETRTSPVMRCAMCR